MPLFYQHPENSLPLVFCQYYIYNLCVCACVCCLPSMLCDTYLYLLFRAVACSILWCADTVEYLAQNPVATYSSSETGSTHSTIEPDSTRLYSQQYRPDSAPRTIEPDSTHSSIEPVFTSHVDVNFAFPPAGNVSLIQWPSSKNQEQSRESQPEREEDEERERDLFRLRLASHA